jgi:hypothetical protein
MTITDLRRNDENKIRTTITSLSNQVKTLRVDEYKNKRYINALEEQIRKLATQLKEIKQEPKIDITSILKEVNEDALKSRGLTKQQIQEVDDDIQQKIKSLLL